MSTIDIIARTKPSENSGAMAANRFAYQVNWGLKKLLELESKSLGTGSVGLINII